MSVRTVGIVSEVSVGYGTPQVLFMARSFADRYGAEVIVYEPDQPERPPLPGLATSGVSIRRIYTAVHPYSPPGRAEYARTVADALNKDQPDLVLIVSFLGISIAPMLTYRPWATLYYALEHTNGEPSREFDLLRRWREEIDLFLFCDPDRASLDGGRLGLVPDETLVLLNGSAQTFAHRTPEDRNGRFFYGGLLSEEHTHAGYFLDPDVRGFPIDLFGIFDGSMNAEVFLTDAENYPNGTRYGGYLSAAFAFGDLLPQYVYSIVMWAPRNEATRFAAPNKFYEAIAAGVPPVATPHPQCRRIIERFQLGVLIKDWSLDAFRGALDEADGLYQTGQYDQMVANCLLAQEQHLSWDRQFDRLASVIDFAQKAGVKRLAHARRKPEKRSSKAR